MFIHLSFHKCDKLSAGIFFFSKYIYGIHQNHNNVTHVIYLINDTMIKRIFFSTNIIGANYLQYQLERDTRTEKYLFNSPKNHPKNAGSVQFI